MYDKLVGMLNRAATMIVTDNKMAAGKWPPFYNDSNARDNQRDISVDHNDQGDNMIVFDMTSKTCYSNCRPYVIKLRYSIQLHLYKQYQ